MCLTEGVCNSKCSGVAGIVRLYVPVPATGETGDPKPVTGKTVHLGSLLGDPYWTYIGPLTGLHPDQPECAIR